MKELRFQLWNMGWYGAGNCKENRISKDFIKTLEKTNNVVDFIWNSTILFRGNRSETRTQQSINIATSTFDTTSL